MPRQAVLWAGSSSHHRLGWKTEPWATSSAVKVPELLQLCLEGDVPGPTRNLGMLGTSWGQAAAAWPGGCKGSVPRWGMVTALTLASEMSLGCSHLSDRCAEGSGLGSEG